MTETVKCDICGREVDKRGLKNHMKTHEKEEQKEEHTEEEQQQEEESKNSKTSLLKKIPALAVGIISLVLLLILGLLTSQPETSKDSQTYKGMGRRLP